MDAGTSREQPDDHRVRAVNEYEPCRRRIAPTSSLAGSRMIETSSPATCHSESGASQRCGRRWLSQPTPRQQQQGRRLRRRRAEAAHFQHVCSRQSLVCSLVSARVRPIAPTRPRPPLSGAGEKSARKKTARAPLPPPTPPRKTGQAAGRRAARRAAAAARRLARGETMRIGPRGWRRRFPTRAPPERDAHTQPSNAHDAARPSARGRRQPAAPFANPRHVGGLGLRCTRRLETSPSPIELLGGNSLTVRHDYVATAERRRNRRKSYKPGQFETWHFRKL